MIQKNIKGTTKHDHQGSADGASDDAPARGSASDQPSGSLADDLALQQHEGQRLQLLLRPNATDGVEDELPGR
jgi:hypothetical protein